VIAVPDDERSVAAVRDAVSAAAPGRGLLEI